MKKLLIVLVVLLVGLSATYYYLSNNVKEQKEEREVKYNVDIEPEELDKKETVDTLEGYGATGALADKELTIMDMLTYAVQDEYLAHAEYAKIMEIFDVQKPYSNISLSEETHLSHLKEVYASYDLEFPADTASEHLIVPTSLLEAAKTGVQAEIDNIAMYEKFLTYDLPDNVYSVFVILRDGSKNHLKAFQKQVDLLQ